MKRLNLGSWKRLGLQGGLLAGVGTAFVASPDPDAIAGPVPDCELEADCSFAKPNFMFILDYSASMNTAFGVSGSRWDAVIAALNNVIDFDNGFLHKNINLAVSRYGHDPFPTVAGSTIANDVSNPPLVDGVALDILWYDNSPGAPDNSYVECNGETVKQVINAIPPPVNGMSSGIGTWTKGGLDFAQLLIQGSRADHMEAVADRLYANVVLTDGQWTGPDGITMDPLEDPAITAADMFMNDEVKTHVVAVADAAGLPFADALASAGGTMTAIDGSTPQLIVDALVEIVDDLKAQILIPECIGGMPRVMVVLDGSSSMLNVGSDPGGPGATGWDQAREAIAGGNGIFDVVVGTGTDTVEDLSHLGILAFGGQGEENVLVDYGACMKDNFAWALDPTNSCVAPGCTDPYAGPTITWTTQDGSVVAPMFDVPTISHMPMCNEFTGYNGCTGSGTYTHLGLELALSNQQAYFAQHSMMGAVDPVNASTVFFNILITDGAYNMFSTDTEVQNSLEALYNAGITTYVIGFGDFAMFQTELANMATWGSNGAEMHFTAANQADLEAAMAQILSGISFDPCCGFNDCSLNPEPTTNEPDPIIMTTGDGDGDGDGDGTSGGDGDGTSGDGDGTSGDGDGTSGDGDGTSGDGDGTSGDGDGTSGGDGDGTSGDGDGTAGDGDGTSGDGDGTSGGDGDGTSSGDGDGDSMGTGDGDGDGDTAGTGTSADGTDTTDTTGEEGTGDETDGGMTDTGIDDGCNCSTSGGNDLGGIGTLMGLGLLGLGRRRRKLR